MEAQAALTASVIPSGCADNTPRLRLRQRNRGARLFDARNLLELRRLFQEVDRHAVLELDGDGRPIQIVSGGQVVHGPGNGFRLQQAHFFHAPAHVRRIGHLAGGVHGRRAHDVGANTVRRSQGGERAAEPQDACFGSGIRQTVGERECTPP